MGRSTDYSDVPEWVFKPEGYDPIRDKREIKVKYQGNIFKAKYWAGKEPGVDPGWELYDELYDVTSHAATQQTKIIAYIPSWKKQSGFNYAGDEMYRYITHGIIAFLMFDENNLGEFTAQSLNDINAIATDVVTAGHRNGVKISIALGGATDYGFLNLMTAVGNNPGDPRLDRAVQNVINFVQSNNLDGVDLDLECWWDKNGNPRNDQGGKIDPHPAGYGLTAFARKLREAMPNKLISAAFFASSWYGNNYQLIDYIDWIGVMTYDLTGSWNNSPVGPHSALYKIRDQKTYEAEQQGSWPLPNPESTSSDPMKDNPIQSVEEALWYWTNPFYVNWQGAGQKMFRSKFVGGVPLYGYDFAYRKDPDALSGQVPPGYKTITYKDILGQFPDASTVANGNIKVTGSTPRPPFVSASGNYPYAHNIYFETPDTAVTKLNFLKDVGAQGVIIWELTTDVWEEGKSIVKALYKNSGNPQKQISAEELKELEADFDEPIWGKFKADSVTSYGHRQYSAILWHIPSGQDWEDACDQAPAFIKGQYFPKPDRCRTVWRVSGLVKEAEWGEIDVKDISCMPNWAKFKRDKSLGNGLTQYSARLEDIPSELDWEDAAWQTPAVIKGQAFAKPTRVKRAGVNEVWGEFDVKDEFDQSTRGLWAKFKADSRTGYGKRQYSAQLEDIPSESRDWKGSAWDTPAIIKGQYFKQPTRVQRAGISAVWGEFDVEDISCIPLWGGFEQNDPKDGVHTYYARLWDIEGDWDEACNLTPAIVAGKYFPKPTRCINKGVAGMWGEFDVTAESPSAHDLLPDIKSSNKNNWLSTIPDSTLIGDINLPGTHDSAAINPHIYTPFACQDRSITDQLNSGIRVLDVRLKVTKSGDRYEFITCHGDVGSSVSLNEYQSFPSLLDECKEFLKSNGTEIVIMSLKVDDPSNFGNDSIVLNELNELLSRYPTSFPRDMLSLGSVRGRILFYNRINDDLRFGVPISWSDKTKGGTANPSSNRSYNIYVQDQYEGLGNNQEKLQRVTEAFDKKKNFPVVLNFASATWYKINGVYIMGDLIDYFGKNPASNRLTKLGWIMFDYPFTLYQTDTYGRLDIVSLIISSNSNYYGFAKTFKMIGHDGLGAG